MKIDNLQKLFVDELKDVYDAEHQILDALPKMTEAATSPELKRAFAQHRGETQGQVRRLEQVFRGLGKEPERKACEGMKGLLEEGKEFIDADGDKDAIDAALISAAQKVEHYEIATYGTLRMFALTLGRRDEAQLLQETLDEEAAADEKLTDIAVSGVNPDATEGNGNGRSRGGLAGLLSSFGIRSRSTASSGGGGKSSGSRSGGAKKSAAKRGAAKKGGAKKGGAKKGGATKSRSAAGKGGSKSRGAAKKAGSSRSASSRGSKASSSRSRSSKGGGRRDRRQQERVAFRESLTPEAADSGSAVRRFAVPRPRQAHSGCRGRSPSKRGKGRPRRG